MTLFLVPKFDTPNAELARVRNLDTMLDGLVEKFGKVHQPKPERIVKIVESNVFGDFDDDPDDDPATPAAQVAA